MYPLHKKRKPSLVSHLLHLWQDLPFGRKLMGVFLLVGIGSLFFPWFFEGVAWSNAFQKIAGSGFCIGLLFLIPLGVFLREVFWGRQTVYGVSAYKIYVFCGGLGMYTCLLHGFGLYELLRYNIHSVMGMGSMISFVSFGMVMMGAMLSSGFIPTKPQKDLLQTPEKVDTHKAHFK